MAFDWMGTNITETAICRLISHPLQSSFPLLEFKCGKQLSMEPCMFYFSICPLPPPDITPTAK